MTADTIACPYCNSLLPRPQTSGPRLTCPRCGESFPYSGGEAAPADASPAIPVQAQPKGRANRRLAFAVLGGMGLMALLSLTYALATVEWRRRNDPKELPSAPVETRPVPPADWAALAYLPPDCNLVLGLNVAGAQRTVAGQAFLAKPQLGNTGVSLDVVERAIGLKRDELDHVVFAFRLDDWRMVLVARTRRPYDKDAVRKALNCNRHTEAAGRTLYHFTLERLKAPAVLWSPDDQTLVVGLLPKDVAAIPNAPTAGSQLPSPLRELLRQETAAADVFWTAGHVNKLDGAQALLEKLLGEDAGAAAAAIRTFVVHVSLDGELRLGGAALCLDDDGAAALRKALAKLKANEGAYLKLLGPGSGGEKVAKALADSFEIKGEGTRVTLRAVADEAVVKQALAD